MFLFNLLLLCFALSWQEHEIIIKYFGILSIIANTMHSCWDMFEGGVTTVPLAIVPQDI